MLSLIIRLGTLLQGSTGLSSLGTLSGLTRVTTLGVSSRGARQGLVAAKQAVSKYGSNLRRLDPETWTTTGEVLGALWFIASELFPDDDGDKADELVSRFGDSDNMLLLANIAHQYARTEDGKDKADQVYDAMNELFTELDSETVQSLMNLLFGVHLSEIRSAGFLFDLPFVEERRLWWDSIQRSEEGVDTRGVTNAEILFFGYVILEFLGASGEVFSAEELRLWKQLPTDAMATKLVARGIADAEIARAFPAAQSGPLKNALRAYGGN
ncbi:hypothetical protein RVD_151 [viral metagenome]